ncbi:MAG: biotin--[acetyl-CoA-carboxylase] ligase [Alphaproteobacteria bacterium]|nr:biotin--[acetyl-CoA-carboxylase] ligase [Alphaproteobacteria bacterium]
MEWRLEVYDSLASTSDSCRARSAEPAGLAIMARRQEQGRGSFGRNWDSPAGNLYLSVLLHPAGRVSDGGLWSLLAAVALADAVAPLLPDPTELRLKWPNDLLLRGGKMAGILLDSTADGQGGFASLVIGIGVNLTHRPDLPDRPTSALAEVIAPPAPEVFAAGLLDSLAGYLALLGEQGFEAIRAAWLGYGPAVGTPLRLTQGTIEAHGSFAGLAENGSILLSVADVVRPYAAGEIRIANG